MRHTVEWVKLSVGKRALAQLVKIRPSHPASGCFRVDTQHNTAWAMKESWFFRTWLSKLENWKTLIRAEIFTPHSLIHSPFYAVNISSLRQNIHTHSMLLGWKRRRRDLSWFQIFSRFWLSFYSEFKRFCVLRIFSFRFISSFSLCGMLNWRANKKQDTGYSIVVEGGAGWFMHYWDRQKSSRFGRECSASGDCYLMHEI